MLICVNCLYLSTTVYCIPGSTTIPRVVRAVECHSIPPTPIYHIPTPQHFTTPQKKSYKNVEKKELHNNHNKPFLENCPKRGEKRSAVSPGSMVTPVGGGWCIPTPAAVNHGPHDGCHAATVIYSPPPSHRYFCFIM